jgi:hypothetical protein
MFAGHVGAAMAIARADRRVNVGILVTAALLLDIVLWVLVLLGWEAATISADFAATHQPEFVFPYSHGLASSLVWSGLAAIAGYAAYARHSASRGRIAAVLAAAVFSHWLLDALVHRPDLPIAGADSMRVGLSLWQSMPLALVVEAAIVGAGVGLFIHGNTLSHGRVRALAGLALVVLVFTCVGMVVGPPPPSGQVMAASSLATLVAVCGLTLWLGRPPRSARG